MESAALGVAYLYISAMVYEYLRNKALSSRSFSRTPNWLFFCFLVTAFRPVRRLVNFFDRRIYRLVHLAFGVYNCERLVVPRDKLTTETCLL